MRSDAPGNGIRTFDTANSPLPKIAILGQVPFTTMVSTAGSGATRNGDIAVNRWRNDPTHDNYGQWCYVKDLRTGRTWSAGHHPVCVEAESYRVEMGSDLVTIHRRDGDLETFTEITVVPGARAESRRVSVTNLSGEAAEVELTSYQEIVLALPALDRGHRAFYNLFVQTEWLASNATILAMRRPRSARDNQQWCGHTIATADAVNGTVSCETDRARFVGRGRTSRKPVAMDDPGDLSGTVGSVLDPVAALRTRLVVPAGETSRVVFTTFVAEDRDEGVELGRFYREMNTAERPFERCGHPESAEGRATATATAAYQNMAGLLLYGTPPVAPFPAEGAEPEMGRDGLLGIGITGDWPVLLASVSGSRGMRTVAELLTAHWYWRLRGLGCDLVIVCGEDKQGRKLGEDILSAITAAGKGEVLDRPQGVFVRAHASLGQRQIDLLRSVARLHIECSGQTLAEIFSG